MVRTRFAPSPTGYLHIGGARTALFNYLFAKNSGGQFVLRIEDTDRERSSDLFCDQLISSLKWLGLDWDEGPGVPGEFGPYYQSLRKDIYQKYINVLESKGLAYPCFCTEEQLQKSKKEAESLGIANIYEGICSFLDTEDIKKKKEEFRGKYVYRFRLPKNIEVISFKDSLRGELKVDIKLLGDFVILKSDGFPTYNFAVVIDDALMKITHIIRGDDHLTNTFRQIVLYKHLEFDLPVFYHISMICGPDGTKLSKRHGAQSVLEFEKDGYLRNPLINFLALLGWSPHDSVEIMDLNSLIKKFSTGKFSKSPSIFDYDKLNFLNGQYIRSLSQENLLKTFRPFLKDFLIKFSQGKEFLQNDLILQKILEMLKNYCKTTKDITKYLSIFIDELFDIHPDFVPLIKEEKSALLLDTSRDFLKKKDVQYFDIKILRELQELAKSKCNINNATFFKTLRIAFCGKPEGIELDKLFTFFKKDSLLYRLDRSISI